MENLELMSLHKIKALRLLSQQTTGRLLFELGMPLVAIKVMANPVRLHFQMEEFVCIHPYLVG